MLVRIQQLAPKENHGNCSKSNWSSGTCHRSHRCHFIRNGIPGYVVGECFDCTQGSSIQLVTYSKVNTLSLGKAEIPWALSRLGIPHLNPKASI